MVEQASHLEYYDDEIASTDEAIRSQVAHDTFGFKVSGIGGHEQRMGRWHLLPLWKGFEDELEWLGRVLRDGNSNGSGGCSATARCSWTRATRRESPRCRLRRTQARSPAWRRARGLLLAA